MNRRLSRLGLCATLAALAGCGSVRVEPQSALPPALVEKLPATIAVHYPEEFRGYLHKETRYGTDYEVNLGPAHVTELNRLFGAMFSRVVEVDDPAHLPVLQPPVRMVLEPRFEDYSFLTPRDMAGDSFTVTIRYRLNVFGPGGERVDGYVFTGFGREKSGSLKGSEPLLRATQRAMREAGAKLAVELPAEDTVRSLLTGRPVLLRSNSPPAQQDAFGAFGKVPSTVVPVPSPPDDSVDETRPEPVPEPSPPLNDAGAGAPPPAS